LALAAPLVLQAEAALDVLDKKDFQELKALGKPPGGVDTVCEVSIMRRYSLIYNRRSRKYRCKKISDFTSRILLSVVRAGGGGVRDLEP
jgi:hypothetical protein